VLLLSATARFSRCVIRSMSAFEVATPRFDFFWNACSTEDAVAETHGVDRTEGVPAVVGDYLQHARPLPLQRLGRHMLLSALRQVDRIPHLVLHGGREGLQLAERVAKPDDGPERRRAHSSESCHIWHASVARNENPLVGSGNRTAAPCASDVEGRLLPPDRTHSFRRTLVGR
jgi:hypothetical protein